MLDAAGILTARGGMTSHAAVVARGMGKCCVSGAGELEIDYKTRTIRVNGFTVKEGDWISLNGSTGEVYLGQVATMAADLSGDFGQLMELAGKYAVLKVRANADTPKDALQAFAFGAEGIGLCRTEHMFFEGDRIKAIREMILADDEAGRRVALAKLLPIQRGDFEGLFKAMNGFPVTVRLLDPPLHEFVPHDEKGQQEMAKEMNVPLQKIVAKVESLAEFNPMLGHRGCRLGNTYPEITEMQARAIIEAAMNVKAQGIPVHVEIMVPLVGNHKELRYQKGIIDATAEQVFSERNDKIDYMVGTMIEVPRAAVTANQIAEVAEFFSFGTNDLTQMTLGFSRDDIGKFLPVYLEKGILKNDPFQILDRNGVGQLIREAVFKGRSTTRKTQMRHLRRARRRTFVGRVLPLRRAELRELLAVPRAHRTSGGRTRRAQREIAFLRFPTGISDSESLRHESRRLSFSAKKKSGSLNNVWRKRISFVYLLSANSITRNFFVELK